MCVLVMCITESVCVTVHIYITVEFLQYQLRRVHVVAVTQVSCVFISIYEEEVCFQETTGMTLEYLNMLERVPH